MFNFVFGLILGLLLAWLAEWLIDWLYWRGQNDSLQYQLRGSQAEVKRLKEQLTEAEGDRQQLSASRKEIGRLEGIITDLQAKIATLSKDDLEDINGIGPVFAKELNEAGIQSFAALAALTPDAIAEIIKPDSWQNIDSAAWIAEAQTRVSQAEQNA